MPIQWMQDIAETNARTAQLNAEAQSRQAELPARLTSLALDNQAKALDVQSQQAKIDAQKRISDALNPPPLVQQGATQAPPLDEATVQQQLWQQKTQAAKKLRDQGDLQSADILEAQAEKHQENAFKLQKDQNDNNAAMVKHVAQTLAPVHDQTSLDIAREQLGQASADAAGVPKVWDAVHSPAYLQQRVMAAMTVHEQMQQQKEVATAADVQRKAKADADRAEAEAAKSRIEAARMRDGLPPKPSAKVAPTPDAQYETELKKLDLIHNSELTAAKKGQSTKVPEQPVSEKLKNLFGDNNPPKSPYQTAVEKANAEHEQRVQELNQKFGKGGVAPQPVANKFVDGKVYTDAKGNKAKYINGKWEPQ